MAADVIDLISSSPPLALSVEIPPSAQPHPPSESPEPRRRPDILVSSIDDNGSIDLTGDTPQEAFLDERSPKRRRTALSPVAINRPIRPPLRDVNRPKRSITLDPIEFTSSPATASQQSPLPPQKRAPGGGARFKTTMTAQLPSSDSDPFADTPPPAQRPSARPAPKPDCEPSSDPFASSPVLKRVELLKPGPSAPRALSPIHDQVALPPLDRPQKSFETISSSAPEACPFRSSPPPSSKKSWDEESNNDNVINLDDSPGPDSADELPDIAEFDLARPARRARSPLRRSRSDVVSGSRTRTTTTKSASVQRSASDRAREREAKAASREAEKERKRLEREEAKNAKVRDKERAAALAEVNKVRTDKKVSTPEMIVDLPAGLNTTVKTQTEALLCELGVDYSTCPTPVPNVVRWRRKVTSRFVEEAGHWVPIPLRIDDERHVLVTLVADEFVGMAVRGEVEAHVAKMRHHFAGYQTIYLLEGMAPWTRKNRNLRNRQFTSGVRSQDASASSTTSRRPRAAAAVAEYISEDLVEDALLELQVAHGVLIHHTATPLETAQWIIIFTQHLSTVPYKARRDQATLGAGFCMESGQVRTGDDARDTYVRMLQEIARVTAPIAYGVAAEFGSVSRLVAGLEAGGPLRLEAVKKSANKDGAFSDRTIGQAVSRRLHKVFTGRDESSTDV